MLHVAQQLPLKKVETLERDLVDGRQRRQRAVREA